MNIGSGGEADIYGQLYKLRQLHELLILGVSIFHQIWWCVNSY